MDISNKLTNNKNVQEDSQFFAIFIVIFFMEKFFPPKSTDPTFLYIKIFLSYLVSLP
jgi:hypothetical protein